MKKSRYLVIGTLILAISALCGCNPKEEELKLPELSLPTVSEEVQGTLKFVSSVVTNGNSIQEYGFYYGTSTPPATRIPASVSGSEFSASVNVSDITPGTPVFVKSYITISSGTISSDVVGYTTKTIPAQSVVVSDDELTLTVGKTYTLTATVLPENTTDVFAWENSNPKIAEISQDGVVKALQPGQTIITAKAGSKTAVCLVSVMPLPESVTLDRTELSLVKGESAQLTATVSPSNVIEPVEWSSSDETVALVEGGKVTAVYAGKATITASVEGKSASCSVTVSIPSEGITLSSTELALNKGESAQLTATVTPADATDIALEWTSSDEAVAFVSSSGLVSAKAGGQAVITVKTGAFSASCTVKVSVPTASVSVKPESATLYVGGEGVSLSATVLPADADNTEVVWESGDKGVATVDASGKVSPVGEGSTKVTARVKNTEITASCSISVIYKPVESVTVSPASMSLYVGEKGSLAATVKPDNVRDKTVAWASSDETVATVSQSGEVTALALGTAEITATAEQKTGKCTVSVIPRTVTSVTLDRTELSMFLFSTDKLTATVAPEGAEDGAVTWSSSNPSVATVDENGGLASFNPGTTVITATAGNCSAKCSLTVMNAYNAGPDKFEASYWNSTFDTAVTNVLPPSGSYGAVYCIYNADLNLYFSTNNGFAIELDKRLTGYKFIFSPEMEKVTDVGGVSVKFKIENEFVLMATVDGKTEKVAELFVDETSHYYRRDHLTFNKSSAVARTLLQTGKFSVYLDISTMFGTEKIDIFFNGKDYFKMFLNPPVTSAAAGGSSPAFIHGRKFGVSGTWLNIDDLFSLVDWRGVKFSVVPGLWDYYGEVSASADLDTAYWTLDGAPADPPGTVEIESMDPEDGELSWGDSYLGFLTCMSYGSYPGNYNFYCRFKVEYGFGILYTDYVRIRLVKN